jgi:hypothetical protein
MKRIQLSLLLACLMLSACKNDLVVNGGEPDFHVETSTPEFKKGTPVTFKLTGDAGMISFYSGEPLKQYELREGRTEKATGGTFAFTSSVTGGTQANQFAVMASSDFNGNYDDINDVKKATWTNITSRFTLGTTTAFTASTAKDISDVLVPGKPLYLAFRYTTKPQATNGEARTWMVQGITFQSVTAIGNITSVDMFTAGMRIVDENAKTSPARSTATTSRITLLGNEFSAGNDPASEHWAISAPVNWESINVGPDRPVAIKGVTSAPMQNYTYTYTKAGTYKAYFVAQNVNIDASKVVVRPVDIKIIE